METRKVQRLGPSTLAITLPAAWTSENNVDKGDELTVHEGRGILTVTANPLVTQESEATLSVTGLPADAVERAAIAQYVLGRRFIHITQDDTTLESDVIDAVYRAETQLMGLGVIEETPERISIRCSVNPADFLLDDLLQRLERTGQTMRSEAVKGLVHGNPDLAQRAINRERQANKIFILLLRLIFTVHQNPLLIESVGLDDTLPLIGYRSVAKNLELTADNAEDIAKFVLRTDGDIPGLDESTIREIQEFTQHVDDVSALGVQSVIDRDFLLTTEVRSRFREIGDRQDELLAALPEMANKDLLQIREVLVSLQQTAQYGMRNAEIAANLALHGESATITFA